MSSWALRGYQQGEGAPKAAGMRDAYTPQPRTSGIVASVFSRTVGQT